MKTNQKNKIQVNFYYLKSEFKNVLLRLCKIILMNNENLLINLNSDGELRLIDDYLWTRDREGFLPHSIFNDNLSDIEKIVLFNGSYMNMTRLKKFRQIAIAPNVRVQSLKHFNKFLIFSNERINQQKLSDIQKKLKNKNFDCKFFFEYQNLKWKILN
tara:strand:+ start:62 stop:535 length:474 start_codon:yes stop_codon:yes gene_type:complete